MIETVVHNIENIIKRNALNKPEDIIKNIAGITEDSRAVQAGFLFAAFKGTKADGTKYIDNAIKMGATHILLEDTAENKEKFKHLEENAAFIFNANPRLFFARIAKFFYKDQPENIIAITGTNGKTSTAIFVEQLWQAFGHKSASLGTLGLKVGDTLATGNLTTPDTVSLHKTIANIKLQNIERVAIEASSHGLKQYRLDGLDIKAAGFTSFSRDHLDYHSDMADYLNAKSRLFTEILKEGGTAVLNSDIPEYDNLKKIAVDRELSVISYGRNAEELKIIKIASHENGQTINIKAFGIDIEANIPLVGEFQIYNLLCALGLIWKGEHVEMDSIKNILEKIEGVPGRLQRVKGYEGSNISVYIDYSHTPDSLETALKSLRPHTTGRLICVFGCGGDRDKGKRPMMGKVATDFADIAILTDDNPRSENPATIRAEIMVAAPNVNEIEGRAAAINQAISIASKGDIVLIAGKGHERGQIFEDRTDPFDDYEEAEKALSQKIKMLQSNSQK